MKTVQTITDIEHDIAALGEVINDLSEQRRSLRVALQPYWSQREHITAKILNTFPGDVGCLRYVFSGNELRKTLYDRLLTLAEQFGELAEQHRDTNADLEAAIRERKRLILQLEQMQAKGKLF